jgi:hypothetical protein
MSSGQPCGVTYLNLLIKKFEVDTKATALHIRRLLTQLHVYMVREAKINVIKFNEYVSIQINTFAPRGKTSNDIITNLFTGYMACTYKKCVKYMEKFKDTYEEGEGVSYQGIMSKAERKYQVRVMNNEWNTLNIE